MKIFIVINVWIIKSVEYNRMAITFLVGTWKKFITVKRITYKHCQNVGVYISGQMISFAVCCHLHNRNQQTDKQTIWYSLYCFFKLKISQSWFYQT